MNNIIIIAQAEKNLYPKINQVTPKDFDVFKTNPLSKFSLYYIVSNMALKGNFFTFRYGYLKIITYRKHLDNGFIFRTSKSFEVTYFGLWLPKKVL